MTTHFAKGSRSIIFNQNQKSLALDNILASINIDAKRVLLIPPDYTRLHSDAGNLTAMLYAKLSSNAHVDILPALGTHVPMTQDEIISMFGNEIPMDRFLIHDWRNGVTELGIVPEEKIAQLSEGAVKYPMQVAISNHLVNGNYDLILSIGQIVPHEVIGMANYTKNICIGVGGADMINKSHYLGAAYGIERILGNTVTPVRQALDYGFNQFINHLPIHFIFTVMAKENEKLVMRGLYGGDDFATFEKAAKLSQQVNLDLLDQPIKKAIVYLEPGEFKSTWLGNKAVYRLRKAMADDGELIILAPALREFGEDKEIDRLIRKYGYLGTPTTLQQCKDNDELRNNLSAAAHLIHGASEGRFSITYCPGENISQQEIESVGYKYKSYAEMSTLYNPNILKDGYNQVNEEEIFYVSNPALGLWALKSDF